MDKANLNPLIVILFYILRCLVPLGLMLGVSYLLRRLGLIEKPSPPPDDWNGDSAGNKAEGDLTNE